MFYSEVRYLYIIHTGISIVSVFSYVDYYRLRGADTSQVRHHSVRRRRKKKDEEEVEEGGCGGRATIRKQSINPNISRKTDFWVSGRRPGGLDTRCALPPRASSSSLFLKEHVTPRGAAGQKKGSVCAYWLTKGVQGRVGGVGDG